MTPNNKVANMVLILVTGWDGHAAPSSAERSPPALARNVCGRPPVAVVNVEQLEPGAPIATIAHLTADEDATRSITVADGVIAEAPPGQAVIDGTGWLALPTLVDAHAHVDKSYTGHLARQHGGGLETAVSSWHRVGSEVSFESILERGRRHLSAALAAGVTAVRTHANYHVGPDPLRGVRALVTLREEFRGLVDLQVVAMQSHDRPVELLRAAARLGPDLVGACPHLTPDPGHELERAAALAEEFGLGLDLHTDETLDPGSLDILDLAARTREWPSELLRTASHCVSLAVQPPERLGEILTAVAESGLTIVTNPATNLYLQGRHDRRPTPRAVPPLDDILAAGVTLAAGGDNVQDLFNPLGRGNMWDVVALLVTAGHLSPGVAYSVTSSGGRAVMGLPRAEVRPGDPADFLLVRASSLAEAIAEGAPDRVVVRDGLVVSTTRRATRTIGPALLAPTRREVIDS